LQIDNSTACGRKSELKIWFVIVTKQMSPNPVVQCVIFCVTQINGNDEDDEDDDDNYCRLMRMSVVSELDP